jgi:plastocyanin
MNSSRIRSSRIALAVMLAMILLAPTVGTLRPVAAHQDGAVAVQVVDFAFEPGTLTVPAGATVTWTNAGSRPHTVTADDGSFDSGRLDPGEQFSQTFDQPGTFAYHCGFHPEMQGSIVVAEAQSEATVEASTSNSQPSPVADKGAGIASLLSAAQQEGLSATLNSGNCTDVGPDVAALTPAFVPTGERVGSARSLPGANSFSTVPVASTPCSRRTTPSSSLEPMGKPWRAARSAGS